MSKRFILILLMALLVITAVTLPTLAQDDPVTAQRVGRRDGETDATRGGACFWDGFWEGLKLSDYEPEPLKEMPSTRLQALADKPGPYAAAYVLGWQIGYREKCITIAESGNLMGRAMMVAALLILYYIYYLTR